MRRLRVLLVCAVAFALGCESDTSLENRPCPCTTGYTCCALTNVCVLHGSACDSSFIVTPSSVRLRVGATQTFSVPLSRVTWSVDEPGGGSIEPNGVYRAPLRPGAYHVRVRAPNGASAVASVVVGQSQLTRVMGTPGGKGTTDGVGSDARFSFPASVVGDDQYLYVSDGPPGDQVWLGEAYSCAIPLECWKPENAVGCVRKHCPEALTSLGLRRVSLADGKVDRIAGDRFLRHLAMDHDDLFAATSDLSFGSTMVGAYIAPGSLREVVRLDIETGDITALAGSDASGPPKDGVGSAARFGGIRAMTGDGAGALYVCDLFSFAGGKANGNALRRVETATGKVTTLAANSSWSDTAVTPAPFTSLAAITYHKGSVYLLDDAGEKSQTIWRFEPNSGSFTTVALFENEAPLAASRVGAFCLDSDDVTVGVVGTCVKRISSGSLECPSPILGGGYSEYVATPNGLWCDGKGNWFVADSYNAIIRRASNTLPDDWETVAGATRHAGPDAFGTQMLLTRPTAITSDALGNVVFYNNDGATEHDGTFLRVGPVGAFAAHPADAPGKSALGLAPLMALGTNDSLYFSYVSYNVGSANKETARSIAKLDLETGERSLLMSETLTYGHPGFGVLAHDGEGSLYVCGGSSGEVRRIDDDTGAISAVTQGVPCGLLTVDGAKRFFSADDWVQWGWTPHGELGVYGSLFSVDLASHEITPLAAPLDGWQATALAYDPAGLLYVAEAHRQRIRGLIVETGEVFDVVGKVGSQGVQLGPLPASLNTPFGIALLPDGSLAITDYAENVLLVAQ